MLRVLIERPSVGTGDANSGQKQYRAVARNFPDVTRQLKVEFCGSDEEREARLAKAEVFVAWRFPTADLARRVAIPTESQVEGSGPVLQAYLGELPSYDMSLDWNRQKTEEPSKQHGFAQFYFTHTFQLLGVSLGHIFKVRQSDVDMRDVVLNRRILVVNLPALESSDERLAALGKIVVASLRGMMAQMLGARL